MAHNAQVYFLTMSNQPSPFNPTVLPPAPKNEAGRMFVLAPAVPLVLILAGVVCLALTPILWPLLTLGEWLKYRRLLRAHREKVREIFRAQSTHYNCRCVVPPLDS